jgi:hypothetical protein
VPCTAGWLLFLVRGAYLGALLSLLCLSTVQQQDVAEDCAGPRRTATLYAAPASGTSCAGIIPWAALQRLLAHVTASSSAAIRCCRSYLCAVVGTVEG